MSLLIAKNAWNNTEIKMNFFSFQIYILKVGTFYSIISEHIHVKFKASPTNTDVQLNFLHAITAGSVPNQTSLCIILLPVTTKDKLVTPDTKEHT